MKWLKSVIEYAAVLVTRVVLDSIVLFRGGTFILLLLQEL
jgi:hypothetical protein